MHACDAMPAADLQIARTLLGAAVLLKQHVTNLIGTVKLLSQALQA